MPNAVGNSLFFLHLFKPRIIADRRKDRLTKLPYICLLVEYLVVKGFKSRVQYWKQPLSVQAKETPCLTAHLRERLQHMDLDLLNCKVILKLFDISIKILTLVLERI